MSSFSLSAEIATVHLLSDGISLQSTYFLTMTASFDFEKHKILLSVARSNPNAPSGNTPLQSACRRYSSRWLSPYRFVIVLPLSGRFGSASCGRLSFMTLSQKKNSLPHRTAPPTAAD
jgi:hypothetical protein